MEPFTFNHEVFGEGFYVTKVSIERSSEQCDLLPLMVSERLLDVTKDFTGMYAEVAGQFRSFNQHEENKSRLLLSVFARDIVIRDEPKTVQTNSAYLSGYICKPPIYRKTPLGREIADIILAVNRSYGKTDYIPCICWGRNARFVGGLPVGEHIQVLGRIQSRTYRKSLEETTEIRTAYEISVSKLELAESITA